MKRVLLLVAFAAPLLAQDQGTRRLKAYANEVKRHLLTSFVEKDRLDEETLIAAGVDGMAHALGQKEFDALDPEHKQALAKLLHKHRASLEDAVEAAMNYMDYHFLDFDLLRLVDYGCMAMIKAAGDPYGRVFTAEEMERFTRMLQGGTPDDSIGAAVAPQDGKWIVMFTQYGSPAHGILERGDEILAVNGRTLQGMRPVEVLDLLKCPVGKSLEVRVLKKRYSKEYTFTIPQRKLRPGIVQYRHLGRGIAYLRLAQFSPDAHTQVRKALNRLKDTGEVRALILDLRDNPGGALNAAVDICDQFLPQGLVVAVAESNYSPFGAPGKQEFKSRLRSDFEEMPLFVLVNGQSASASELTSGSLKDHKRGKIIGQTTYGKGVGQSAILLSSMMRQRFLYLTVMKYYLPASGCPDHQGIRPDIELAQPAPTREEFEEILRLRDTFEKYVADRWTAHKDTFARLAENDLFDPSRYPDFDAVYQQARTTLSRDLFRAQIRRVIRRRLEDERNALFDCDLEADLQLQKAVVEALQTLNDY